MAEERPTLRVVSAEIQRDGLYLLTQRSAKAVLPLLWEFPGGRVRDGESDEQALARAIRYRLGIRIIEPVRVLEVRHEYDDYDVVLVVLRCGFEGAPEAHAVQAMAWVHPDDFGDYPFPDADQRTVEALLGDDVPDR